MRFNSIQVVKRRVDILEREGITFKTNINVGKDVTAKALMEEHDAVVCALGATWPRDLPIPGIALSQFFFFKRGRNCEM